MRHRRSCIYISFVKEQNCETVAHQMSKNSNKKVTHSMAFTEEQIKDAFKIFDPEGTGYVNAKELRHIMVTVGNKMDSKSADAMIKDAGADRDGNIDYAAFAKMMLAK
jgi:Ca2+-binding EF-hand superfamily protein